MNLYHKHLERKIQSLEYILQNQDKWLSLVVHQLPLKAIKSHMRLVLDHPSIAVSLEYRVDLHCLQLSQVIQMLIKRI